MYVYKIGYSSHENSGFRELFHEKIFTKVEFEDMVVEVTLELLINRRKDNSWMKDRDEGEISNYDRKMLHDVREALRQNRDLSIEDANMTDDEYVEEYGHKYYTKFSHIYQEVGDIMIEKYNFVKVKYEQIIDVDGWGSIVAEDRSFGEDDDILNRIKDEYLRRKK